MNLSIVNILSRLRRHTAVVWLLIVAYALGAGYATVHTHNTHHETAERFHQTLHEFLHALELDDHSHHWDSDAHDCSSCQLHFSHPAPDTTNTVAILKTHAVLTPQAVRYFSHRTPTKRLTRAPPVV